MRKTRGVSRPSVDTARIIAFALIGLGALAAISGVVLLVLPSRFEAVALLTIHPSQREDLTFDTEIKMLRSETILKRALQQLPSSSETGTPGETADRQIADLRKRLRLAPVGGAISIRVTARDPEAAADTANAIVSGYSNYCVEVSHLLKEQEVATVRARVDEGYQKLEEANQLLLDLGRSLGLSNASPDLVEITHPTYMEAVREYNRLEESVSELERTLKDKEEALLEPPADPQLSWEEATADFRPVGPNRKVGVAVLVLGVVLLLGAGAAMAIAKRRRELAGNP